MADVTANRLTSLPAEEVIVRSLQFFTTERWRAQSQSSRAATFMGRPPIPVMYILLTILGFLLCIVPGVIMYIAVIRKMIRFQNIVVTANPKDEKTEVVMTHPDHAKKLVDAFFGSLPA